MRKGAERDRTKYRALVVACFTRDGWRCVLCRSRRQLTPHHIRPRSALGADVLSNLVTLCLQCHRGMDGAGWKRAYAVLSAIARGDADE
jgi:5-methylcytosine-specific restriction endonuclease McrA